MCVPDPLLGVGGGSHYRCRCEEGFLGHGFFCKKSVIGCNIINSCGRHAHCLFDYEEHGYRWGCGQDGYLLGQPVPNLSLLNGA